MIPDKIWLGENINPDNIWIGNILKCTKYKRITEYEDNYKAYGTVNIESTIYKENAILIEITNGGYIDLDFFKNDNLKEYMKIYNCFTEYGFKNKDIILTTVASKKNSLFIEKESLKKFYNNKTLENTSVKELKKVLNK